MTEQESCAQHGTLKRTPVTSNGHTGADKINNGHTKTKLSKIPMKTRVAKSKIPINRGASINDDLSVVRSSSIGQVDNDISKSVDTSRKDSFIVPAKTRNSDLLLMSSNKNSCDTGIHSPKRNCDTTIISKRNSDTAIISSNRNNDTGINSPKRNSDITITSTKRNSDTFRVTASKRNSGTFRVSPSKRNSDRYTPTKTTNESVNIPVITSEDREDTFVIPTTENNENSVNENIYRITTIPTNEDVNSLDELRIMEKENNKHLSWDSGNCEETTSPWYNDDVRNDVRMTLDDVRNATSTAPCNYDVNNNKSIPIAWNDDFKNMPADWIKNGSCVNFNDIPPTLDEMGCHDGDDIGDGTPDAKIISWHTLSIMTLQNMIIDQSEKIKQLEMSCHLQEILIKNQKDEIDLHQERVDQLEVQVKEGREERMIVLDRLDTLEGVVRYLPQSQDATLTAKVNELQNEVERQKVEKEELQGTVGRLEATIDEHKDEMDLLLERIDESMKSQSKDIEYLADRTDTMEEYTQQQKRQYDKQHNKLDSLECIVKNMSNEAMELVSERLDNLVIAFEENKKEKEILLERIEEEVELFLERVANLEVALHSVEKYGGEGGVIEGVTGDREAVLHTQEAISDLHSKVIDTYTDTEAALNVIHNMLHKDKLTKII